MAHCTGALLPLLAAALLAVVLVGSPTAWGAAGGATAGKLSGQPCPYIPAGYPSSELYGRICSASGFQALLTQWGIANYSVGETIAPTWTVVYLGFIWVGSCGNSSWAAYGPQCADQEYWGANVTSGTISGPSLSESPLTCACGPELARSSNPWSLDILIVGIVAGATG